MNECSVCILNDSIKGVTIEDDGRCNFCHWNDEMNLKYEMGFRPLERIILKIKEQGKGKRYDALIGVSGGCDSSYLLKVMALYGVRMLAVHWDNGWNTDIAFKNIKTFTDKYEVDLKIRHADSEIYDNLCKSFLYASTPDADIPNDMAIISVLYEEAEIENIDCFLIAHSFRTEGTCPNSWTYQDGKYIESVNDMFGKNDLTKFPNMTLKRWINWLKIQRIRPLYHIDYRIEQVKKELVRDGWSDYESHHGENKYTKFIGNYIWKKKFNQDLRYVSLSAQIRNNHITKEQAQYLMEKEVCCETVILEEVKERLGLSNDALKDILKLPIKTYMDYDHYHFSNYKEIFEEYKDHLPKTFMDKYVNKKV